MKYSTELKPQDERQSVVVVSYFTRPLRLVGRVLARTQDPDGHYVVIKLPWKNDHPELPANEGPSSNAQPEEQIRCLRKTPELLAQQDQQVNDYVRIGFA